MGVGVQPAFAFGGVHAASCKVLSLIHRARLITPLARPRITLSLLRCVRFDGLLHGTDANFAPRVANTLPCWLSCRRCSARCCPLEGASPRPPHGPRDRVLSAGARSCHSPWQALQHHGPSGRRSRLQRSSTLRVASVLRGRAPTPTSTPTAQSPVPAAISVRGVLPRMQHSQRTAVGGEGPAGRVGVFPE